MSSSKSKHRGGLRPSSSTPSPSSSAAAAPPPPPSTPPPAPQRAPPARLFSVREVDTQDGDFGATLWLPQVSMLAASLSASQLVSVSVCHYSCSDNAETLEVEDLEERCMRHFNFVVKGSLGGGAGRHCAIASAWPCRKLKEGVRISKQLACALGCLQPSVQVCVSPITGSGLDSCCKGVKMGTTSAKDVCVQDCQELVLMYCPVGLVDDLPVAFSSLQLAERTPEDLALEKDSGALSPCPIVGQPETPVRKRRDEDSNIPRTPVATPDSKTVFRKGYFGGIWEAKENRALTLVLGGGDNRATKLLERLGGRLLHGRYLFEGNFVGMTLFGQCCIFRVVDAKGSPVSRVVATGQESPMDANSRKPGGQVPNLFLVGNKTHIELIALTENVDGKIPKESGASSPENPAGVSAELPPLPSMRLDYSLLGGLSEQITTLKEIITFSLLQPGRLMSLGLQPPHGVLLHGPPGTGKTSLALASATEAGVKIFHINGPEVISEYFGESEAAIKAVFEAAQAAAPSVVFIDELDAIAPQRAEGSEDLGRRMVATLLTIMDGGQESLQGVLVIAATNRVETIDPALRRPGRFDREIEIGVPSPSERHEILLSLLSRMGHALAGSDIEALAAAAHGFVGADLSSLCNEAAMVALRHHVHKNITTDDIWCSRLNSTNNGFLKLSKKSLKITIDDFEEAKMRVRPSAMREVMLEVPKVRWSDVGGQEDIKQQLQEAVEWPQKHMDAFARIGTQPPRGVLLYGPPGCSKTLMARAVATEAGLNFIAVKGPELFSKWVGESEKAVRSLFQRARVAAPSVVFFDELDGLAMSRDAGSDGVSVGDRVMSQLLVEMDGLSSRKGVTVIAATNRPDKIDAALLRPGRFDRLLYVGPPDKKARRQIFEIHTRNMPCAEDVDKMWLATQTNGYTGADIASVCRESAMAALEEDLDARVVSMRHFNAALCSVQPSISQVSEYLYAQFSRGMQNLRPMS